MTQHYTNQRAPSATQSPVAAPDTAALDFIARWQGVSASGLATAQSFVIELCALLDVSAPHATPAQDYMFERPITFAHGDGSTSVGRIDCYRRGCFVLETKKLEATSDSRVFDEALLRTRSQANWRKVEPAIFQATQPRRWP